MSALQRLTGFAHAGRKPNVCREPDYSRRAALFFKIAQPAQPGPNMRLPRSAAPALALILMSVATGAARADVCFTVLDAGGRVLHQSRKAPVDMSRPISESLNRRFPSASLMVFGANNESCPEMQAEAKPPAVRAPRATRRL